MYEYQEEHYRHMVDILPEQVGRMLLFGCGDAEWTFVVKNLTDLHKIDYLLGVEPRCGNLELPESASAKVVPYLTRPAPSGERDFDLIYSRETIHGGGEWPFDRVCGELLDLYSRLRDGGRLILVDGLREGAPADEILANFDFFSSRWSKRVDQIEDDTGKVWRLVWELVRSPLVDFEVENVR